MQDRFRGKMGFLVVALLTGAIGAACSSDTTEPSPPNNEDNVILMLDDTFAPALDSIDVGETITWRNDTATPHTIESEDDEWADQTVLAEDGWEFEHTFDETGSYDYECSIHNGMTGTIVVE